uniref:Reverse transcriptase domain-containing protein n=1 Tax=Tanacetum cinerariifolium TaxID=118510 RepID=A0A699HKT4_TANCI|nr:reverse transcriptase domain-containing protein [Tanacetum cinerariifolium]
MDDEPMWVADCVVAPTPESAVTIPETKNEFAIKSNHLTLVKGNQFDGRFKTDPHKHIYEFLIICDMFKYKYTKNEAICLMMFPLSLTGEAKTWLDGLNEGTIETWDELRTTDDEDEEPTPQLKVKTPKPVKEMPIPKPYEQKIPYPQRLRKEKMEAQYGKFLDMIQAVRINVPLVDVSAGMPNYRKFLKELIRNNKSFSCNALVDLGARINLMSYSLYAKLSFKNLKPTKMSVRLADRSFQHPIGIAENILVEEQLNLGVRTERMTFHIDSAMKHSYSNIETCFGIDVINETLEEDFDALLDEGSKILHSIEGTILEEKLFAEFDE